MHLITANVNTVRAAADLTDGKPTSTKPIASIFAWIGGLKYRGRLEGSGLSQPFGHFS